MITKERLEELIEQHKQVWKFYKDTCAKIYQVPAGLYGIELSSQVDETTPFDELFEAKEDAEEYAEFGNITRTERLELPSWEDFKTTETITKFFNKDTNYSLYVYVKNKNTNNCKIMIYADNGEQEWWEFQKPLTRENYNEARRLCVKLFKGEEL